uniref:Reverse transcriptase Ty1/copia-type domain-containing protein n=1 Tax=Peronospora matthiolae TaxID=2874970 RepID=A0AAV1THA1_9STRA
MDCNSSTIHMETAESDPDTLNEADQTLWNDMLRNSILPEVVQTQGQTSEQYFSASSSDKEEGQESESTAHYRAEYCDSVPDSNKAVANDSDMYDDDKDDAESGLESHNDEETADDDNADDDTDADDDTASGEERQLTDTGHITDPEVTRNESVYAASDYNYDCLFDPLFDPSDMLEAVNGTTTLTIANDQLIGHRRPRDVEVRRSREHKRIKEDHKRAKITPRLPILRKNDQQCILNQREDFTVNAAFRTPKNVESEAYGTRASDVRTPKNFRQAMCSKYATQWKAAMDEELEAMKSKGVITLISKREMPEDTKAIKTMWVYSVKTDHLGNVIRLRARIVARGDKQRPGIDYGETFSPVARMATFRMFVAICLLMDLTIYQGDINTAYLNAPLGIKQYLDFLDGYPSETDDMVYVVHKALYGLKQSGREWNTEVNAWFLRYGFKRCTTEPCLYYYDSGSKFVLALLYVDDILCATKNELFKTKMFRSLDEVYGMKDQGLLSTYLGVQVERSDDAIKIHQTKYCEDVINRFNFGDAHASRIPMETNIRLAVNDTDTARAKRIPDNGKEFPYRELIGSLMYLATCTRPDLAYVVGQLSRYVQSPTQQHIGAAKRVLRYLVGSKTHGIVFHANNDGKLRSDLTVEGFCDTDWGNDPDTRKSITGYVHCLAGGAISWASRRQSIVAQSTAEAEYVAACEACMEGRGLIQVLIEIFPRLVSKFRLGIDNKAAFVMATNPTYSRRTRHIELRWHYVRDQYVKKAVELWKVKTDVNPSDLMTEPLASARFEALITMIGMTKNVLPQ